MVELYSSGNGAFGRASALGRWLLPFVAAVGLAVSGLAASRRRTHGALDRERQKLRQVVDGAPFAVVLFEGPEFIARYVNAALHRMVGGRLEIGRPLTDSMPELKGTAVIDLLEEVRRTGETLTSRELKVPLVSDGGLQDRWFDVTWQPLQGSTDGSILVSSSEVTEHVLARKRLEHARRITEVITSNASLGLFMMDARQHCTFMNAAAEQITGFRLDEVQGAPLHELIHHSHPDGTPYPMAECPIDRALPTKSRERGEDVFIHKDGHFYPVAFTASPIVEDGKPVGTVIELRDTTEEKGAEQRLRAAIAARDEFLSVASHELRTPLTALGLQLERLRRLVVRSMNGSRDEALKNLDVALKQADRLEALVEGLLNVSRIRSGRLVLHRSCFDLCELVYEVVERLSPIAKRERCQVRLEVPSDAIGAWDRDRLDEVVTNLLGNAMKYGPGQPIDVRLVTSADAVTLTIRDRGIGVPAEEQERIFGRFERAVPAANYGGLGLGLYIAQHVVEAHGGEVSVESAAGQGASFTVRLPRGPSDTPGPEASAGQEEVRP